MLERGFLQTPPTKMDKMRNAELNGFRKRRECEIGKLVEEFGSEKGGVAHHPSKIYES